jgi:hypothetical protein
MLKRYQHLYPLFENVTNNWDVDEDYSLEIFEMTTRTNEPQRSLPIGNLWFKKFQMNMKYIKCFL